MIWTMVEVLFWIAVAYVTVLGLFYLYARSAVRDDFGDGLAPKRIREDWDHTHWDRQ